MPTHEKKRRYSRADVSWPVFLLTPHCIVRGETKNISLGGAFIHFLSDPVQERSFRLVIKPPNYEGLLVVSAEVAWRSRQQESRPILPRGMGVQFTQIPSSARSFLDSVFSCSF